MDTLENVTKLASLPVIGSIATMPSRAATFGQMILRAHSQVDKLFVFLDGFTRIPSDLQSLPNCHFTLLPEQGSLHASSRFLAPHMFGSDAIVVMFDDDILYPTDYVNRIKTALSIYGDKAIVGFHGCNFIPPHLSFVKDRQPYHFSRKLANDKPVHLLGVGTAAFVSSSFSPNPEKWKHHYMDDLFMAAEAINANLAMIALKREADWIIPLAQNQDDSLWRKTKNNDRQESLLMRYVLSRYVSSAVGNWWKD